MKLTDRTRLAPTLSAIVISALFETGGSERKARELINRALDDEAERSRILDAELDYSLRAYRKNTQTQ